MEIYILADDTIPGGNRSQVENVERFQGEWKCKMNVHGMEYNVTNVMLTTLS